VGGSTVSRRVSEFVGVALFATALIWIISLASYEPSDPVWFFSAGAHAAPVNFAGRVGAFLAELSFQLFGYASYLIPAAMVIVGWNYFWCRSLDAAITKATGASLLLGCISAFLSLVFGTLEVSGKAFRAGGYAGEFVATQMADYLNRTGSMIVILTFIFLAIIMTTQFSFGRFFGALFEALRAGGARAVDAFKDWREERRREKQRRDVIAKHTKKGGVAAATAAGSSVASGSAVIAAAPANPTAPVIEPPPGAAKPVKKRLTETMARAFKRAEPLDDEPEPAGAPATSFGSAKSFAPPKPPKVSVPAPLPLAELEPGTKAPAERRKGDYTLPPPALLDAAKTERKIDERELMDGARLLEEKCREFSVEGSVVQIHPGPVVTTFEFKPDAGVKYAKITGLADDLCLAMQAESVLIDRIPGKSTVGI